MAENITSIPINLLDYSERNPRQEMRDMEELAESIREYGVIQPITVRPRGERFEIVIGERRVRAATMAGLREIKAQVKEIDDATADEIRLVENIHRDDLTEAEKGDAILSLLENRYERYPSLKAVADKLKVNYWTMTNKWLPKARKASPHLKDLTARGEVSEGHMATLLKYEPHIQDLLVGNIMEHGLSREQTIKFLKLYDERGDGNIDDLAKEAKGIQKISLFVDELPPEVARAVTEVINQKGKPTPPPMVGESKTKMLNSLRDTIERKRRGQEKAQNKEVINNAEVIVETKQEPHKILPLPLLPVLPEDRERVNKAITKEIHKIQRDSKTKELEKAREIAVRPLQVHETKFDDHKIIIGDAKAVLKLLPESSVDLVVTSPPYFDLKDYPEHTSGINTQSIERYLQDLEAIFNECFRILKDGRFFCIVVGQFTSEELSYFIPGHISQLVESAGFRYRREHIWVKPLGIQGIWNRGTTAFLKEPYPRNTMINIHHEHILIFQKGDKPAVFYGRDPLSEREVKDYCWSIWELYVSLTKEHPAPFPDSIPERLIKMYSYEGEVVLDPFLGSGTTTKMAKQLKRHSAGIEVSPEYLDLIQEIIDGAEIIRFDKGEIPDFNYLVSPKS